MGVQGGIGVLGISTVIVLLLFLSYPGYWVWRLGHMDVKPIDLAEARLLFVLAFVSSLAVVPGSFGDTGFVFVPISVGLTAVVYSVVHNVASRTIEKGGSRMGQGAYLGFLLPPLVLGLVVLAVTLQQASQATAMELRGVAGMNTPAIGTFLVMAVLPCAVASAHIVWRRRQLVVAGDTQTG